MNKVLDEYIKELPEVYQNIYGFPEYNQLSSRNCKQREIIIGDIVREYQKKTGKKNLRVLDLGCAQGYYSFSLANEGCIVEGIDFSDKNIALCNVLQQYNGLNCTFREEKITQEFVDSLEDGKYDVVLLFSVIHHVCNEYGFEYARTVIETILKKSKILLCELALKEEPLYWNEKLPESYSEWFSNIKFFDEQSFFETHLSEIKRPFIYASNQFCFLNHEFYSINHSGSKAYDYKSEDSTKKYYICENNSVLIKMFRNSQTNFLDEIKNEIDFVANNQDISFLPRVLYTSIEKNTIKEVTGIRFGELLWDKIINDEEINYEKVFLGVLDNCVELEKKGFYHGDLRMWNIVVDKDGTGRLIDFGHVSNDSKFDVLKSIYGHRLDDIDVYDSFISMVYDTLIRNKYLSIKENNIYELSIFHDLARLPKRYILFIRRYLILKDSQRSFELLHKLFVEIVIEGKDSEWNEEDNMLLLEAQFRRLQLQSSNIVDFGILYNTIWTVNHYNHSAISDVEKVINILNQKIDSITSNIDSFSDKLNELAAYIDSKKAEDEARYKQKRIRILDKIIHNNKF